jgi:hypothetical protein
MRFTNWFSSLSSTFGRRLWIVRRRCIRWISSSGDWIARRGGEAYLKIGLGWFLCIRRMGGGGIFLGGRIGGGEGLILCGEIRKGFCWFVRGGRWMIMDFVSCCLWNFIYHFRWNFGWWIINFLDKFVIIYVNMIIITNKINFLKYFILFLYIFLHYFINY